MSDIGVMISAHWIPFFLKMQAKNTKNREVQNRMAIIRIVIVRNNSAYYGCLSSNEMLAQLYWINEEDIPLFVNSLNIFT